MAQTDHSIRKHALLSASGSHRWINCPPSARLEEKFEESNPSKSSVYADEGTLAHEFGDINLKKKEGLIDDKTFVAELERLRKDKLYYVGMEDEVDKYVTYVMEQLTEAKKVTPDAVLLIEEKFDFSHIVEQGFGTGDASIIADGTLEIIDLKFGKGVRVDAKENSQLKLYALGALRSFDMSYDINKVRVTIVQPRLDHIDSWEVSVDDLLTWSTRTVKPRAEEAYTGKGLQKAGEHCRWCKVKALCATLAAQNTRIAQHEFKDPHLLTEQQLLDVYKIIPMIQDWANAVGEYLLDQALKGKDWPGYKVVEGRSLRKWVDEEKVYDLLTEKEYAEDEFMVSKLAGIPAIEKLVGKKVFPSLLGDLVILPPGKPTLVPMSDKRPAMGLDQARMDFSDESLD